MTTLVEAEDAFDVQETMLDLRTHLRLGAITAALSIAQRMIVRRLLLRKVACMSDVLSNHFALASISRVTHTLAGFHAEQIGQRLAVVHVGGARHHQVNQLAAIHADVQFFMPTYH